MPMHLQCPWCQQVFGVAPSLAPKRQYCSRECYHHARRDPAIIAPRFWTLVDQQEPEACWPWLGTCQNSGLGKFTMYDDKTILASKMAYMLTHGDIPPKKRVWHLCNNVRCCNPGHLSLKRPEVLERTEIPCVFCGMLFSVLPSKIRNGRKYCSHPCQLAHMKIIKSQRPVEERFWEKVSVQTDNECWPWLGATNHGGHGVFAPSRSGHYGAHVYSYLLAYGPIPAGKQINHHCGNAYCCNPLHLYAGTQQENFDDMKRHGVRVGRKPRIPEEVFQAITKLIGTMPNVEIARMYNVTPSYVSAIRHGYKRR